MVADDADGKTTENVIVNSPKSTNKEYSSSTEPTSTNDYNQTKLGESSTRTQSPSTTPITIQKNGPTTTPKHSTENVTDNSPNQTTPKNGYNLSHKNYSFTERILTKPKIFDITVVTMRNKQKKFPFLDPISSILANRELPTRYIIDNL
ncbi:PREDICTED: uncharacterized protein LOC107172063 [Diuraphis noxia]|uniref:uncharacterized protein LOC107172063 n=1 Tax=Diuraphis noxia TaxID=143948 RepID=UPI00076386B3|nr:PREDICTED: uncharacterized protein LOC107172063 [Diuraphis noxia]